jgi:hypothetical protein
MRESIYQQEKYKELLKKCKEGVKSRFLSDSLEIKNGEEILYLGFRSFTPIKNLIKKGAKVVVITTDETSIISLRREGIWAILMNPEYIHYTNRFEKVICEDPLFHIQCPSLAFEKIINSLKSKGEAFLEVVVGDGNQFIKEINWEVLRENGYMYSLYSPRYFRKDRLLKLIPQERLELFESNLIHKIEILNLDQSLEALKPYIKIASAHLTKDQQKHFEKLFYHTIKKRLQDAINNSLTIEYSFLNLYMKKR